eukprot:scaffold155881_cov27-Tisochrysis_lutea.AAC.5
MSAAGPDGQIHDSRCEHAIWRSNIGSGRAEYGCERGRSHKREAGGDVGIRDPDFQECAAPVSTWKAAFRARAHHGSIALTTENKHLAIGTGDQAPDHAPTVLDTEHAVRLRRLETTSPNPGAIAKTDEALHRA